MARSAKIFVLVVGASPYTHQAADTALQFAKSVLKNGHQLEQVFFYYDGVYVASSLASPEQSERKVTQAWSEFSVENELSLVVCSNSAMKRGIMDDQHAASVEKPVSNTDRAFVLAGLGQFVEATMKADRVITFGI